MILFLVTIPTKRYLLIAIFEYWKADKIIMFKLFKKFIKPHNSGDRFHCGAHQFSTNDQLEWRKHNTEEIHTQTGNALCNYCGNPTKFSYTGKIERPMTPALCNDCKQKINQTIQNM